MLIIKVHIKRGHSCETLLLKVVNDILWTLEHQELNAMLLLDLSAEFDVVVLCNVIIIGKHNGRMIQ